MNTTPNKRAEEFRLFAGNIKLLRYAFLSNVFFLSIQYCLAQAIPPLIKWQQCHGGSLNDEARNMKCTGDGGSVFAGITQSNNDDITFNFGYYDYWVAKCDVNGNIQWQQTYGGSTKDWARYIDFTSDNGFLVIGNSDSRNGEVTNNHGDDDFWMMKLDSLGNLQFQKSLGGSGAEFGYSIHQTSDGGSIVFGGTKSVDGQVTNNHGDVDYWLVKLNADGDLFWQKTFGGSMHEEGSSLSITKDGGYIISGFSNSTDGDVSGNHGSYDMWIIKTDSSGNIAWKKCYGGSLDDGARDIEQTSDGGYIITGYATSSDGDVTLNRGGQDVWIIKIDSIGKIIWQKTYGGSLDDYSYSVNLDSDENYLIAGYTSSSDGDLSTNYGKSDAWVLKVNRKNGAIIWQKTLGGSMDDMARSLLHNASGDYTMAGITSSNNYDVSGSHGEEDAWLVDLCVPRIFYLDADKDGYGDPADSESACGKKPAGYVSNNLDCDDQSAQIHPGAIEVCGNAIDDNCNNQIDEDCINECASPIDLFTTSITANSAKLNWDEVAGAVKYKIRYKVDGTRGWTNNHTINNYKKINGLSPGTAYDWEVKTYCQLAPDVTSDWTSSQMFTTSSLKIVESSKAIFLQVYPNPADQKFTIDLKSNVNESAGILQVVDMMGRIVYKQTITTVNGEFKREIQFKNEEDGIYVVKIIMNSEVYTKQLVISK